MFIRYFKSSFISQYLVIVVCGLLLWSGAIAGQPGMPMPEGPVPLYSWLYTWLEGFPLVASALGLALVLAETYWLTRILSSHELVLKNSSLPAFLFIVMMSLLPGQLTLTPINITLGLMIMILYHMLIAYNKPEHLDRIFAAGFFTALASMIYFPFLLWFIFVIVSFLVIRAGNWRAWLAAFIGLITPYLYLSLLYFWQDDLVHQIRNYADYIRSVDLQWKRQSLAFYLVYSVVLLFLVWGLFRAGRGPERTVEIRIKTNMILWTIPFTLLSFMLAGSLAPIHPGLAMPAMAMFLSVSMMSLKKTRLIEILFILFIFGILLNNLFYTILEPTP